jgi:hypothetical protein
MIFIIKFSFIVNFQNSFKFPKTKKSLNFHFFGKHPLRWQPWSFGEANMSKLIIGMKIQSAEEIGRHFYIHFSKFAALVCLLEMIFV